MHEITPKPQLLHMIYSVVTRNRRHHTKYTLHQHQLRLFKLVIQRKKYSSRKLWKIISRSHMTSLPGNRTLCGKFPIIKIKQQHWITITTGGTQHDPNHEGCTNHQNHEPKLNPSVHMLNHQFQQKQKSLSKHPTLSCRRGTQGIHKYRTPIL